MPRIPLPLGSSPARSALVEDVRLVNGYVEAATEQSKGRFPVYGAAGMLDFANPADALCRGMIEADGTLYSVHGAALYSVTTTGVATRLGTIPGADAVIMARNAADPFDLAILCAAGLYIYSDGSLSRLFDPDILDAAVSVDWLSGYFVIARADGRFYVTGINDTTLNGLDFATAEGNPDGLVRGYVHDLTLFLMGARSIEAWTNTGNADFPFERIGGAVAQVGLGAKLSVARLGQTFCFVDDLGIVRRMAGGYRAERISGHGLEKRIEEMGDFSGLTAFSYADKGHEFYVLSCNDWTWVFDQSTGQWHERRSGVSPRWQANHYARFAGKHIVGSVQSGKLYQLTDTAFSEAGEPIIMTLRLPVIDAFPDGGVVDGLYVDVETGTGSSGAFTGRALTADLAWILADSTEFTADQTHDVFGRLPDTAGRYPGYLPEMILRYSDDGAKTWKVMPKREMGRPGRRNTRVEWRRLGAFGRQGRVFELAVSAPVFRAIVQVEADIAPRVMR